MLSVATVEWIFDAGRRTVRNVVSTEPDWTRMGQAAKRRRGELGVTQEQLVRPGLAIQTIRQIEKGKPDGVAFRPNTLATMSAALRWPADALERIAQGEAPPTPVPVELTDRVDALEANVRAIQADLADSRSMLRQLLRLAGAPDEEAPSSRPTRL